MDFYTAFYDMDENSVFVWLTDGRIIAINCTKVENASTHNLYERSELDYLIYNEPTAYAELILNGDPDRYLKSVTTYKPDESLNWSSPPRKKLRGGNFANIYKERKEK